MTSRRVLVVESSEAAAKLFTIVLRKAGFEATVARSVREAITEIRRRMPDAMVCELLFGFTENGYDVLAEVRACGATIRCVAMTGLPDGEIERDALAAGFDRFLRKPFQSATLVASLSGL